MSSMRISAINFHKNGAMGCLAILNPVFCEANIRGLRYSCAKFEILLNRTRFDPMRMAIAHGSTAKSH